MDKVIPPCVWIPAALEGRVVAERHPRPSACCESCARARVQLDAVMASTIAGLRLPAMSVMTLVALDAVHDERRRQDALKEAGRFKYTCADVEMGDGDRLAVLTEELGEVARAMLERAALANDAHGKNLRAELVQVAAVAVAWIEAIDGAA